MVHWRVKRARDLKGRYEGDDKSTVGFNEAWVAGRSPKKTWFQKQMKKFSDWFFRGFYGK